MPEFSYDEVMGSGNQSVPKAPSTQDPAASQPAQDPFSYDSVTGTPPKQTLITEQNYLEKGPQQGIGKYGFSENSDEDLKYFMGYTNWAWSSWFKELSDRHIKPSITHPPESLADAEAFWKAFEFTRQKDQELYDRVRGTADAFYIAEGGIQPLLALAELLGPQSKQEMTMEIREGLRQAIYGESPEVASRNAVRWQQIMDERRMKAPFWTQLGRGATELVGSLPVMTPAVQQAGMARGLAATAALTTEGGAVERTKSAGQAFLFGSAYKALAPTAEWALGNNPGLLRTLSTETGHMVMSGALTRAGVAAVSGENVPGAVADPEAIGHDVAMSLPFGVAKYRTAQARPIGDNIEPLSPESKAYERGSEQIATGLRGRAEEAARKFTESDPQSELPGQVRPGTKEAAAFGPLIEGVPPVEGGKITQRNEVAPLRAEGEARQVGVEAVRGVPEGEAPQEVVPTSNDLAGGLTMQAGVRAGAKAAESAADKVTKVAGSHIGSVEAYGGDLARDVGRMGRTSMEESNRAEGRTSQERDTALRETGKNTPETRDLSREVYAEGKEYAPSALEDAVRGREGAGGGPASKAVRALVQAWGSVFEDLGLKQQTREGEREFKSRGSVEEGTVLPRFMEAETQSVLQRPFPKMEGGKMSGGDPRLRQLVEQTAQINFDREGGSLESWRQRSYDHWKRLSDQIGQEGPDFDIGLIPAEIARELPHLPAAVKIDGPLGSRISMHVLKTNPYEVVAKLNRTNAGRVGVISVFGQGREKINELREQFKSEYGADSVHRFNNLIYTLHNRPAKFHSEGLFEGPARRVMTTFSTPGGAAYLIGRVTSNASRVLSSLLLSGKALKDPFELARGNLPTVGRALVSVIRGGTPEQRAAGQSYLKALEEKGLYDPVIRNWSWDPRRPLSSFTRLVTNAISKATGQQVFDDFSERVYGQASEVYVGMMRSGKYSPVLRSLVRDMRFDPAVADRMLSGKASPEEYRQFQRQFIAKYVPSRAAMAERSIRETHPAVRSLYKFSSYAESVMRDLAGNWRSVLRSTNAMLENPNQQTGQAMFEDVTRALSAHLGTALAGVLAYASVQTVRGFADEDKLSGIKRVGNEALDDPMGILVRGFADAITSGPFGAFPRIMQGEEGASSMFVPISMSQQAWEAWNTSGRYSGYTRGEAMLKFIGRSAPGVVTATDIFGSLLSETVEDRNSIARSRAEFFKYLQREVGPSAVRSSRKYQDFDIKYKSALRKLHKALNGNDFEAARMAIRDAYASGATTPEGLSSAILNARILPDWMPGKNTGPEKRKWKWDVIRKVKSEMLPEDWDRIVAHDRRLEAFARLVRRSR